MSDIAKAVGQRIRNYRTKKGLSQEKLAELSGCHPTYIGQLERGEKNATLPKGQFVVMKTGVHPMRVKLKLFFKWGIEFDEDNPYAVPDHGGREVQYAEKKEIMDGIIKKYHPDWIVKDKPATDGGNGISGQDQAESESHEPQQTPPKKSGDKKGGGGMNPVPPNRRTALKSAQEVKPNEPS